MERTRLNYLGINLIGGIAVLSSYAHGLLTHPGEGDKLWGALPPSLFPLYLTMMPLAAVGYLTTFALVLRTPPSKLTIQGAPAHPQFSFIIATFLIASVAWMPLCWAVLDQGREDLLSWIQLDLMVAGATALIHLVLVARLDPGPSPRLWRAALVGAALLMVQCTILDAFVWPRFFAIPIILGSGGA